MVDFTLFRLNDRLETFDEFVDLGERAADITELGPVAVPGFQAKLYLTQPYRRTPGWVGFLEAGFPGAIPWPPSRATSALLVVRVETDGRIANFAFAFGPAGRHLLREGAFYRRYGLITALNLIADQDALPKLRAFDTTRHGQNIIRARLQATSASGVEVFELDLLRDLVQHATGEPADVERWGRRVGGSDALRIVADVAFADIAVFCSAVDEIAQASTYRERFGWVDNVSPVTDGSLITRLESEIVELLRTDRVDLVQLAPPEVVDWDRLSRFQYHFDTRRRPPLTRPDLSLAGYLSGLRASDPDLAEVTVDRLRTRRIIGLDAEHELVNEWSVWRCLSAEFTYDGRTYVLDDGTFYAVDENYLQKLNADIVVYTRGAALLPEAQLGVTEPDYNRTAAGTSDRFLLLDADEVTFEGAPGGIELCDILTADRQLIHVKRYGGSAPLSHLFAQARTSAELLLMSREFRGAVQQHIRARAGDGSPFDFVEPDVIRTSDFEVVLSILKRWRGSGIETLPLFAKINLRRTLFDLVSRGYKVSVLPVSYAEP